MPDPARPFTLQTDASKWAMGAVLGIDVTGQFDFAGDKRVQSGKINLGAYEQ